MSIKSVGTEISEPMAHTIGSAFFVNVRSFGASTDEATTPNKPEKHVIIPNTKGILKQNI